MSGTATAEVSRLVQKNLLQAVRLYDPDTDINLHADQAGKVISSTQGLEEIAAYDGLMLPTLTDEYGAHLTDQYKQIYEEEFISRKYMLTVAVSDEVLKDEQDYGIVRGRGTDMAGVFHQATEVAAANVFMNLADDNTTNPGPNGVAIASASHPLENGVQGNILSPAMLLSPDGIRKAKYLLKKVKAHKGHLMPIVGDTVLEVSAEDEDYADELLNSRLKPDTPNNNKNSAQSGSNAATRVLANPYYTFPNRWCLRIANSRKHGRFFMPREKFRITGTEYIRRNDSHETTGKMRILFGVMHDRGTIYSLA